MRKQTILLLLTILFGCSDKQAEIIDTPKTTMHNKATHLEISAINMKFPLILTELNFDSKNNIIHLNDDIISKIKQTVINDYNEGLTDSLSSYKETYINTIRLQDSFKTIFMVLLKSYPSDEVGSRVLFYDNQKKKFAESDFEFKLYALYDYDNGRLKAGYLKNHFNINSPEIELIDFNKDGVNDYKFVRLLHNGTFNAIHTTILTIKNNKIDTLHFDEKPIGNDELLQE